MKVLLSVLALSSLCFAPVASAQTACDSEDHRAFDFWIGHWTVTLENGDPAGSSRITAIQDGCVILENWVSANPPFRGTSHNFYDPKKSKWRQIWLDNQGGILELEGERIDHQMILSSAPFTNSDGEISTHTITWTLHDDGVVQQKWETSTQGKETIVAFDGFYRPSAKTE